MRRVSKRDIGFRFDLIDEIRVPVIHRERTGAQVQVEGVDCLLTFSRSEWNDWTRPGVIKAAVSSYPNRQGDGWLAKGTRPDPDALSLFRQHAGRVCLGSDGLDFDARTARYEAFARRYPVGSIVEARTVSRHSNKIRIELPGGLITRMAASDYVDRWPSCRRTDVGTIAFPEIIEVIVRRINPERHGIAVTMHGYPRDSKYCDAASGYRHSYDAANGLFKILPWNRVKE
jgi:hypothetical protein